MFFFDVPTDDTGIYLPERARFLDRLTVGQCFSTTPWAGFFGTSFSVLARRPDFVVDVLGSVLQAAGDNRWCAISQGDGALRACVAGVCGVFGVVVNDAPQAPTLTATVTPTTVTTSQSNRQTVCLALSVTAEWSSGVRQTARSPCRCR